MLVVPGIAYNALSVLPQDRSFQSLVKLSTSVVAAGVASAAFYIPYAFPNPEVKCVIEATAKYDTSLPLRDMVARDSYVGTDCAGQKVGCGISPPDPDGELYLLRAISPASIHS